MTSRRYSETDIALSTVNEENDENVSPLKAGNETPRAKLIPSKKSRISDSPLSRFQQNSRTSILEEMGSYFCKCEKFEKAMSDYKILREKIQTYTKSKNIDPSKKISEIDFSFCNTSQMSFLEAEMQVFAEETCKCERFKTIIKEYNIILENYKMDNSDDKFDGTEIVKLKEQLEKAKLEMEKHKKAAESSKAENDQLKLELEAEKESAKNRIENLQNKFKAMKLEDGNERTDKVQENLAQLKDKLSKAQSEAEGYRTLADKAQNVIDSFQTTLKNEKDSLNAKIVELKKEKDAEINALKLEMNISMEKEMKKLNQKLNETETLFYQLQTDIKLIEDEKTYFENLNKLNEGEFAVYKKSSVEASNNLEEKIAHLSAELAKIKEENKTLTKSVEKSQSAVQEALKNPNVENAESQTQENVEKEEILKTALENIKALEEKCNTLKENLKEAEKKEIDFKKIFNKVEAENKILSNENWKFEKFCSSKDDEIMRLKEAVAEEKYERQKQVFQLSDQLSKATDKLEEFKNSTMGDSNSLQTEIIHLKEKLESFEKKEEELKKKCDHLETKNEDLERQAAVKDFENIGIKESTENEKLQYQKQLTHLNNELSNFKSALTQANLKEKEISALKETLKICEQKEDTLKKDYNQLKSQMDVLENEKNDLQYACAAKDVEINKFLDQKRQLETEYSLALQNLRGTNEEVETLRTTLTNGKQKYLNLKEILKQRDEEIEALNAAEGEAEKQSKEIYSLKKKMNHYKKEISESENVCNYLRADIEVLQTKKAGLEKVCRTKDDEITALKDTVEKEKAKLQRQISKLNDQFLKATNDLEGYKAAAVKVEKEIGILRATLENERNLSNAKIAEIQKQKYDEIEAFKASFGDTVSMKEEIAALKEKLQLNEQKMKNDEKIIVKAKNDIAFLKSEKVYLETNLSMKKSEIAELQQKVSSENDGISGSEIEVLQTENQKLGKSYQDIAEVDAAKKESDDLLFGLKSKLDNINTSNILTRATFNIPEELSEFFSHDFTFKPTETVAPESSHSSESVESILNEIRKESEARNSKLSKNLNRKIPKSSKKDYDSEESCNTQ